MYQFDLSMGERLPLGLLFSRLQDVRLGIRRFEAEINFKKRNSKNLNFFQFFAISGIDFMI
jgi:hypothetical protein